MNVTWIPFTSFVSVDLYYSPVQAGYPCTHFTDEAALFRLAIAPPCTSTSSSSRDTLEACMLD